MNLRKEEWEQVKLGNVCVKAKTIDIRNQNGTFNYIDIGSIDSNLKRVSEVKVMDWMNASSRARQMIKLGDTLFSTVRVNLERVAFLESEIPNGIASTGFTILRSNEKVDPKFLFYSTSSPNFITRISLLQKGTAYPAVTDKIVFDQEIPLPPLSEQKQIAALFQSIEAAVEEAERQEERLKELKKELLRGLFSGINKFGKILNEGDFEKSRFDRIAFQISERVEPKETELEIYVGLEHLDSENLKITRTGKPDDVIGTKLKIYTGDIIFGKRRAYQRKVAVSHFNGIASAHSMILRANEATIEKDFLPYFMQCDAFMERAVQISEGSLSPTIKWKNLAAEEFYLPNKEKQKQLSEIFIQFDNTIQLLCRQKATLRKLKQQLLEEILG